MRLTIALFFSVALCSYWAYGNKDQGEEPPPQEECPCSCLLRECRECDRGSLTLDLERGTKSGGLGDVTVLALNSQSVDYRCSHTALVKAKFTRPSDPLCHDVLKIEMGLGDDRKSWMFDFGDSSTNNGNGGDSGTQYRDAELDEKNRDVRMWASDASGAPPAVMMVNLPGAVNASTDHANVWIANEYFKFRNNLYDYELCHPWLYALNGQSDTGGINYDVYLAFNRVVLNDPSRNGWGVCNVRISWVCRCEVIN